MLDIGTQKKKSELIIYSLGKNRNYFPQKKSIYKNTLSALCHPLEANPYRR